MRKFDLKSIALGFIIGTVGITTAFAANGIKSATFNSSKVYFYNQEVPLKNQLVAIVKDGETNAQMYMPVRELLEYMNFVVEWDEKEKAIYLTMNGNNANASYSGNTQPYAYNGGKAYTGGYDENPSTLSKSEADRRATDIIQRTGNWSYIEPYLPYMTNEGINSVVNIYNSKRMNTSEHKKAVDYIN